MIIFVGVAGSGKSTQGKLLASAIKSPYFSMGEFLREHVDGEVKAKMLTGELVTDQDAISILDQALNESHVNNQEFILDGFPRTVVQAEWLAQQFKNKRVNIKAVFHLSVKPEVVLPRLLNRHRPDDNQSAINLRIKEYQENISMIVRDLKEAGVKVYDVNGEADPEFVHKEIMDSLISSS